MFNVCCVAWFYAFMTDWAALPSIKTLTIKKIPIILCLYVNLLYI